MNKRQTGRSQDKKKQGQISRKIMMKKYGLDEGKMYVEQCTLLEPNNFIPSWEAGDEEKKEVSLNLRILRKKYDNIHKFTQEKQMDLELIKKGVQQIKEEERLVEKQTHGADFETNNAKQGIEQVIEEHDAQMHRQQQFIHMLSRMKKDLIALQITSNQLQESLRSKNQIYKEEFENQRSAKEQKLQSRYRLDNLMQNIEHEQKKRDERIIGLQNSIKNKEEALQKRVDRVKKQQEIAEAAANENRDQGEIRARADFQVQKLWSQFLKKKMENEMNKYRHLEDAFQKIRTSTGNGDVQEMVHKFLTREQTYAQLLSAVSENEKKLDKLRQENDKKEEILHILQIDNDSQQQNADGAKGLGMSEEGQEIIQLLEEIGQYKKEFQIINNRKKNIHLVCDQVTDWTSKVSSKLDSQLGPGMGVPNKDQQSMSDTFQNITNLVCEQLDKIIEQKQNVVQDEEGDEFAADDMQDFATEDFITKNIRVRPQSGATTGAQGEESKSLVGMEKSGDGWNDDEKFNRDMNYEMDQQRKHVKAEKDLYEKRKQYELDQAERNRKKK